MTAATAHDLSTALETLKTKVDEANEERTKLVTELRSVITQAESLLGALGEGAAPAKRRGRPVGSGKRGPGRPKGSGKRGRPKRRKMSPEARAKIAAAQKKRWAKVKAEKK